MLIVGRVFAEGSDWRRAPRLGMFISPGFLCCCDNGADIRRCSFISGDSWCAAKSSSLQYIEPSLGDTLRIGVGGVTWKLLNDGASSTNSNGLVSKLSLYTC